MKNYYYQNNFNKKRSDKIKDGKSYLQAMVNREKGLKKLLRNCKSGDYDRILTLESQIRFVQEKIMEQCQYLDKLTNTKI